jgi:Tfp pilus assembly protein PilF
MNMDLGANTFTISAYDTGGNPLGTPLTATLLNGRQFRSNNILKELGAPFGSFGPIKVESMSNRLLSAVSEVRSSQGFAGFFPGQNVDFAWYSGIILDVVDDGPRGTPTTYRTNLGLNAVRPGSTSVTIILFNESGQPVGNPMATTLAANGLTQFDGIVQRLRGSVSVTGGYLRITSSQPIIAWASKIENGTDDPSFQIGIEAIFVLISQSFMTSSLRTDVAQDFLRRLHDWDWKGGENAMRMALELNPKNLDAHYNYAVLLMAQGRFTEAIGEIQIAEQLDPGSEYVQSTFGKILFNAGKPDEAILRLKRAIERHPRSAEAHHHLGQIYEQMGKYTEALAIYDKARGLRGNPPDNPRFLAIQAGVYARMGKRTEAKRMLAGIKTAPAAAAHAYLGDRDEAFRLLFSMVEEHEPHVISLKSDPQFTGLHSDPRWPELLRRINLPTE